MEILHHVWELEKPTVAKVQERNSYQAKSRLITTVMDDQNHEKLNDKGYPQVPKDGVTYVKYSAAQKTRKM